MDSLLQMADELLVELMTYEKVLNHISMFDIVLHNLMKKRKCECDLFLARISTVTAVNTMYDIFRLQKWEEIQCLSNKIKETALSIGYTSYQSLIEHRANITQFNTQASFVTEYWIDKEVHLFRQD